MAIDFSEIPKWESRNPGTEPTRLEREVFYQHTLSMETGDDWSLLDEAPRRSKQEGVLAVVRISYAPFIADMTCVLPDNEQGRRGLLKARECMEKMRTLTECTLGFGDCYPWKQPKDKSLVSLLSDLLTAKALVNKVQAINVARQKLVWVIAYRKPDGREEVCAQFLCGRGLLGEDVKTMFDALQKEFGDAAADEHSDSAKVAELAKDASIRDAIFSGIPLKGARLVAESTYGLDENEAVTVLKAKTGWSDTRIGYLTTPNKVKRGSAARNASRHRKKAKAKKNENS